MKKKITPNLIFHNLDAIICGTTLTLCVILVNVNVIFRYFLNNPIKWTDEVVTSLFRLDGVHGQRLCPPPPCPPGR